MKPFNTKLPSDASFYKEQNKLFNLELTDPLKTWRNHFLFYFSKGEVLCRLTLMLIICLCALGSRAQQWHALDPSPIKNQLIGFTMESKDDVVYTGNLGQITSYNSVTNEFDTLAYADEVYDMVTIGDNLYVTGRFLYLATTQYEFGTYYRRMARYNFTTQTWSGCGGGIGLPSQDNFTFDIYGWRMVAVGNDIYVAGNFSTVGNSVNAPGLAKYNTLTDTWSSVGSISLGVNTIYDMIYDNGFIYVTGSFVNINDNQVPAIPMNRLARYEVATNTWQALGVNGTLANPGSALSIANGALYVASSESAPTYLNANRTIAHLGRYDTQADAVQELLDFPVGTSESSLLLSMVSNNSDLYLAGRFRKLTGDYNSCLNAGGYVYNVARFNTDDEQLHTLGYGITHTKYFDRLNIYVHGLTFHDGQLYATGYFDSSSGCHPYNFGETVTHAIGRQCRFDPTPVKMWYLDADSDGWYINTQLSQYSPGQGWTDVTPAGGLGDCNDNDPGVQNDPVTYYLDEDSDGYAVNNSNTIVSCAEPGTGYRSQAQLSGYNDCDDANPLIHPGMTEVCGNGIDDDCDGLIDEVPLDPSCVFGSTNNVVNPLFGVELADISDYPYQSREAYTDMTSMETELIAGVSTPITIYAATNDNLALGVYIDVNADGVFDEYSEKFYSNQYSPNQSYNYGNITLSSDAIPGKVRMRVVSSRSGTLACSSVGLNDGMAVDYTIIIKNTNYALMYPDDDHDGYGGAGSTGQPVPDCGLPSVGFSYDQSDCDDNNASINPDAQEIPENNVDDDCDGQTDEPLCEVAEAPVLTASRPYPGFDNFYNVSISGDKNDSYQWVVYRNGCGDDYYNSTQSSFNAYVTSPTTFYVRGEGGATCGNLVGPCTAITLVPGPSIPTITATSTSIQTGQSTTLSISSGTLGGADNWVWYADGCGNGTPIGVGSSITVTPSVTTTYYARGEGASLTPPGNCGQIYIDVLPPCMPSDLPILSIVSDSFDLGSNIQVDILTGNLNDNTYWAWYTDTSSYPVYYGSSYYTTLYSDQSVFVRGQGACDGPFANVQLFVRPCLAPDIPVATASQTNIIVGDSVVLSVSGNLNSATNWYWYTDEYGWNLVGEGSSITLAPETATTYYVRAEGGCSGISSFSTGVTVSVTDCRPASIFNAAAQYPSMSLGASNIIYVNSNGLNGNYDYIWYSDSCGGKYLGRGTYLYVSPTVTTTYYVRAEGGTCAPNSACYSVTVTVTPCVQPTLPVLSASSTSVSSGQATTLSVSSGQLNSALYWAWYRNDCSGAPIGYGTNLTVYPNATTTYYCRGIGGCISTGPCSSITITYGSACTPPTLAASQNNISCSGGNNGAIDLSPIGGSGPLSYVWTKTGGGFSSNAQDINNLTAGTYNVTVTANGGCTATASYTITEPLPVSVMAEAASDIPCGGGDVSVTVSASGGTAPYTGTGIFTVNSAGTYSYFVTDANGCVNSTSVTVGNTPSFNIMTSTVDNGTISPSGTVPVCGGQNQEFTITPDEGYEIEDVEVDGVSVGPVSTYTFYNVTGGGSIRAKFRVKACTAPSLSADITNASCSNLNDGKIVLTTNGGTNPFTYSWTKQNDVFTSQNKNLDDITAGDYTVVVTAAGGCTSSATYTVSAPLAENWYMDDDNDGYYTGTPITSCSSPGVGYRNTGLVGDNDCDDGNSHIQRPNKFFRDADGDGLGNPEDSVLLCLQFAPAGFVSNRTDCNDNDARNRRLNRPGYIYGLRRPLCDTVADYHIDPVQGAVGYAWTAPLGATIIENTGLSVRLQFTDSYRDGVLSVQPYNYCLRSIPRNTTLHSKPLRPNIEGPLTATTNSMLNYSVESSYDIVNYEWKVGRSGTILTGQGTPTVSVEWGKNTGTAQLRCKVIGRCGETNVDSILVNIDNYSLSSATVKSAKNLQLVVYPNPITHGVATVVFNTPKSGKYKLILTDINGSVLMSKSGISFNGSNTVKLDLTGYSIGTYLITLITETEKANVMIEKTE